LKQYLFTELINTQLRKLSFYTWSKLCRELLAVKSEFSAWDPLESLLRLCFSGDLLEVILAMPTTSGNNLDKIVYFIMLKIKLLHFLQTFFHGIHSL
jgi:hypothetical protein